MSAAEDRTQTIAMLRAVADLLEADETIPVSDLDLTIWFHQNAPTNAPAVARILSALPAPWKPVTQHYGGQDFLEMQAKPGRMDLSVIAPASDLGVEVGRRTVMEWEPIPEIKALLGQQGDQS